MEFDLGTTVVAIPEQVSCDLAGEAAVLCLRSGVYYGLNSVSARIWSLVQTPTKVEVLLESILAEYEVAPADCQADLQRVLGELVSHGLLVRV